MKTTFVALLDLLLSNKDSHDCVIKETRETLRRHFRGGNGFKCAKFNAERLAFVSLVLTRF